MTVSCSFVEYQSVKQRARVFKFIFVCAVSGLTSLYYKWVHLSGYINSNFPPLRPHTCDTSDYLQRLTMASRHGASNQAGMKGHSPQSPDSRQHARAHLLPPFLPRKQPTPHREQILPSPNRQRALSEFRQPHERFFNRQMSFSPTTNPLHPYTEREHLYTNSMMDQQQLQRSHFSKKQDQQYTPQRSTRIASSSNRQDERSERAMQNSPTEL
jgi:hypothetical protein